MSTIESRLAKWDITNIVTAWSNGSPNYGIYLNSNIEQIEKEYRVSLCPGYYGDEDDDCYYYTDKNLLTVTYAYVPSAPAVTSPAGGEIIDSLKTITWTAATDQDTVQSSIAYQIDLSLDVGGNWSTIVPLTQSGVTSYQYDFTSFPASSNALIRVRGFDGSDYGNWGQSLPLPSNIM